MQSQFKFLLLTFSHLLAAKDGVGKYSSQLAFGRQDVCPLSSSESLKVKARTMWDLGQAHSLASNFYDPSSMLLVNSEILM